MAGPTYGVNLGLTIGAQSVDYLAAGGAVLQSETGISATLFWPAPVNDTPDTVTLTVPATRIMQADATVLTLS